MAYKLTLKGFVLPNSLKNASITLDGVTYSVQLEENEGIEDLIAKFETAMGLPSAASTTPVAATANSTLEVTVLQLSGTPTITFGQDGTEPYTEYALETDIIELAQVDGIFEARGRLGAWDQDNAIYWSSYNDVTDFEPSLATQANVMQADAVRGKIIKINGWAEGFVIHSTDNTVLATYSGDQFVFSFSFLDNKGIIDPKHVAAADNMLYGWDVTGLYAIDPRSRKAELLAPELTEFLNRQNAPLLINYIGDRYLCILFGKGAYSYSEAARREGITTGVLGGTVELPALPQELDVPRIGTNARTGQGYSAGFIYDTVLKKWGRIDIDCDTLLSLSPINQSSYNLVQQLMYRYYTKELSGLAMLYNGITYLSIPDTTDSHLVFGRYQLTRSGQTRIVRVLTEFDEVPNASIDIEVGQEDGLIDHTLTVSDTGISNLQHKTHCHPVGKWFNILVKGTYRLKYLMVEGFSHGKR